jgi:hypothetical protein
MSKKHIIISLLTLFISIVLPGSPAWSAAFTEGDWEVTMTTTMQGMPYQMPPMTYKMTHCITQEDMAPVDRSKQDCVIKDQKMVGSTFYWKVTCEDSAAKTDGDG